MLTLVCGDRDWTDGSLIEKRLQILPLTTTILEGGCQGADLLAREAALKLGLDVIEIPANWIRHGKAAGPIRNRQMLDLEPTLVIAFHPHLSTSKGTYDCVREAIRRRISVEVIDAAGIVSKP